MAVRERIRKIKHLRNHYFICVLENPTDLVNEKISIQSRSPHLMRRKRRMSICMKKHLLRNALQYGSVTNLKAYLVKQLKMLTCVSKSQWEV